MSGVRFPFVASTTFVGPLPANANETVILTTPPLNIPLDFAQIIIEWSCNITGGTGALAHVFRIRRGTTAGGLLVNAVGWQHIAAAAVVRTHSGQYVDTPGAVAGQQYSLTVVQTGVTAAGTFNDGVIFAYAL